ncbi:MAG: excinuclease ABC subunit B [Pseudomonadota bacterium]
MRSLFLLLLLGCPAHAWEASIGRICTLRHEEPQADMRLTFDPAGPEYSITVTLNGKEWRPNPVFSIAFEGPVGLTISTGRHQIGGASVTVTDSGFGNVLNGLEYNWSARAILGDQEISVSLAGAAPAVRAFRACVAAPTA